jgi:outer membrane protein assembly factor BamB
MKMLDRRLVVCAVGVALVLCAVAADDKKPTGSWTQWGGPSMEFRADSTGLKSEWPAEGPKELWSRDLGDGYSAVLVEDGRAYTMYRDKDKEVVVCLDATNGKTIWQHSYAASPSENHVHQFGDGPRSTPLLVGDQLFTIGVAGNMHALDKKTGKVQWSHTLWDEYKGTVLEHGYASSPVAYKDSVIVLVGGEGNAVMAFKAKDGAVKWKSQSFKNSYSTPRILKVDGQEQVVAFMMEEAFGLDPNDGKLRWRFAHQNQFGQNVSMPVMADEQHLLISSPEAGAKGLKLTNGESGETKVEELWATRKIQFYHVNTVRDGDWIYGSTGTMGPAFLAAVNIRTGEIGWRMRDFAAATCVMADGKLYVLDEEGNLALTTVTPKELVVHSKVKIIDGTAWTVPTIAGTTMYLRDKQKLRAVSLS